jgi:DNA anti-recombination protein RmuC
LPQKEYDKSKASPKNEVQNVIKSLVSTVKDLQTCIDLIAKHGAALQRCLSELESLYSARSRKRLERDQHFQADDRVQQLAQQPGGLEQAAKEHSIPERSSKCFKHSKMHEGNVPISGFRGDDVCE